MMVEPEKIIYMSADQVMLLETEIWEELEESVQMGARSTEEAHEAFMDWRAAHRAIGQAMLRGAKVVY